MEESEEEMDTTGELEESEDEESESSAHGKVPSATPLKTAINMRYLPTGKKWAKLEVCLNF